MNNTVDFQTAIELKEAGFPEPDFKAGQFWHYGSQLCMVCLIDLGRVGLQGVGVSDMYSPGIQQLQAIGLFAPTALEIIAEMPFGTSIHKRAENDWMCWFKITEMQPDFRHDPCPHNAAAKAFLAWKKRFDLA